jgi:serine protease AprX
MKPDLVAPGTNILSCYSSSHYTKRSGTSMATPVVSGAIALYLEKHPTSTNKDVKLKLRSSCDDLHYPKNRQGWGRINLTKLLN